jgi:hypothetical protein
MTQYFDEKAAAKALEAVMPAVEEMCAHLLAEKQRELGNIAPEHRAKLLPQYNISDGGLKRLAVTRNDFELLLTPWKHELGRLMLQWPRREGSTIASYLNHLTKAGSADNWWNRFDRMKDWLAHIARIDDEERAEREREAKRKRDEEQERQAREREARRRAHERAKRQASPDPVEIKRLLAVIAEAEEIEALLALHEKANDARRALTDIYKAEREGCEYLDEPVPEREVPGWPNALDPPTVTRVEQPTYLPGDGPGRGVPALSSLRTSKG